MELRRYLRILRRRWWIAVIAFLMTGAATFALVLPQPPVYESTGTALLRPRLPGTEGDAIDASDLLIRGVKIAETYATVARSELIRTRAEARLDPSIDPSGIMITAAVLTDTNILSISATGLDPEAVHALNAAVLDATVAYAQTLNDAYLLSPLDEPTVPRTPVGPDKELTIAIGLVFGILLAVVLALFAEYLREGGEGSASDMDPRTGLHNQEYLRKRLREEMSRSDRTGRAFTLAVFRVTMRHAWDGEPWRAPATRDLQRIGGLLRLTVREEVVLAHLGDGDFGALLPDMGRSVADRLLSLWEAGVIAVFDGRHDKASAIPHLTKGVCEYRDRRYVGDREAILAVEQLSDRDASARIDARTPRAALKPVQRPGNGSRPAAALERATSPHPGKAIEAELTPAEPTPRRRQAPYGRWGVSKRKPRAATRKR